VISRGVCVLPPFPSFSHFLYWEIKTPFFPPISIPALFSRFAGSFSLSFPFSSANNERSSSFRNSGICKRSLFFLSPPGRVRALLLLPPSPPPCLFNENSFFLSLDYRSRTPNSPFPSLFLHVSKPLVSSCFFSR